MGGYRVFNDRPATTMAFSSDPPLPLITASMTLDYLCTVQLNEWLEVRLEFSKKGRQLTFATVVLHVGERMVARASGVFAVPTSPGA